MSATGLLIGLINILITVAILILIGAIVQWVAGLLGFPLPPIVVKLYMVVVALIALVMIISMLVGIPPHGLIRYSP